jgi:hypothetical protein
MAALLWCPACQRKGRRRPLTRTIGGPRVEDGLVDRCARRHRFPVADVDADDRDYVTALAADLIDVAYGRLTSELVNGSWSGKSWVGPHAAPACYYPAA